MARNTFNDASRTPLDIILERFFTTGDPRLLQAIGENSAKRPEAAKTDMDRAIEGFLKTGDENPMRQLASDRAWETGNLNLTMSIIQSGGTRLMAPSPTISKVDAVRLLLQLEVKERLNTETRPPSGPTPDSQAEVVRMLLEAGAKATPGSALEYAMNLHASPEETARKLLAAGAKAGSEGTQAGTSPKAKSLILKI